MKTTTLFLAAVAAFCGACGKSATVQGEGGAKLALSKPAAVTLIRGGSAKSDIHIKRTDLPGAVSVVFDKLPRGVSVTDPSNQILGADGTYTLEAAKDADLVENFEAQVTATGPGGLAVTEPMKITVKEQKQ